MNSRLEGKTAVITGASEGIGKRLVEQMAIRDVHVYALARRKDALEAVAQSAGGRVEAFSVDVSDPGQVEGFFKGLDNCGVIPDILVNNAGVGSFDHVEDTPIEEWDRMIAVNLSGAFYMVKHAVRLMKQRRSGTILNVNSVAGKQPFKNATAYCASKYGLTGLTAVMREELRKLNIRVIGIHPGAIASTWWEKFPDPDSKPFDRMLQVDDVVDSILNALELPDHAVQEEIVIRFVGGNF